MSEQKEKELFIPNTAREALELLEEQFPDKVERDALEGMWDYGNEAGLQRVIDFLRSRLDAEFINEEDENMFDAGDS